MEILKYTEDHQNFRKRLRRFLEKEVTPFVDQWEEDRIVPKSVWQKMGQAGFLCMDVAPQHGGQGADFLYSVIVLEELTRTWHTGLAAALHNDIVVPYISSYGSEKLKKKYLPGCVSGDIVTAVAMTEPDAGSDLAGIRTAAVEEDEEIVIDGSKTFISNGINADLVVLAARDPAVEDPYQAISLYLVESGTPGFERGRHLEKMGMWSQDTAELFFSKCRIPKNNRLGDKGSGFLMLMGKLQPERLVCALGAVAAAERILEWTLDYCKTTEVQGKPLSKSQATQFALVELSTEVKIGRTFIDKLISDHMEGKDIIIETSMAKYWTTEMLNRVANRCIDLCGDYGLLEKCPLVRAWRDAKVMTIFAGTNEIMKNIAAKFMGL
ncbi:MAG: acyl-CoA dehydrogenase family protein [Deltaproteobacteria bacterium]|jgi:alkylation response protein AidB-like acyl-CoA dehydrogenase|nr:acyl-CoA dehydrogenase family protein [Deltaproteobacteria bacterium]